MATQQRAKVGGELGANGEWYEGGKFINTTAQNHKRFGSVARKLRRVEIEPRVWVEQPEGKRSIYRAFVGIFGNMQNGKLVVNCSPQVFVYFQVTREHAQSLADKYNAGERWVDVSNL